MKKLLLLTGFASLFLSLSLNLRAENLTEAGLTLLEPSGARAAALGEAFSSVSDDITAFGYNPASLQTLKTGQASFLFQRGMGEDSFGQFMIGKSGQHLGWGISLGLYNSGTLEVYDGTTQRSVTGQKDMNLTLGGAHTFGKIQTGLAIKYFSSELAERSKADVTAVDLGLQYKADRRLQLGTSIQNIGGQLRYESAGDDLPRTARAGLSWLAFRGDYPTTFLLDGIYRMNQKDLKPALGIETLAGPIALRAGYKTTSDLEEFNFGMGLYWSSYAIDYTVGLVDQLSSSHRISLSSRFGGAPTANSPIVKKKPDETLKEFTFTPPNRPVYQLKDAPGENPQARIYFVKQGDTLQSISKKIYGRADLADEIFRANQHLIPDPQNLKEGQRILVPPRQQ